MSAAEKISSQRSFGTLPGNIPGQDSELSQNDVLVFIAMILSNLNFLTAKNRSTLLEFQTDISKASLQATLDEAAKEKQKIDEMIAKQEQSKHVSWWQKLFSYFNPLTLVTMLVKAIFKIDLSKIIADKMKETFKHMTPAERDAIKGLVVFASLMPGLCVLAMAMNTSGLLSYQTLLAAGEKEGSLGAKIAGYIGMAIDTASQIALAVATTVAISVATGGAGAGPAIASLVAETLNISTKVVQGVMTAVAVAETAASIGSASSGIAQGAVQVETANILEALAPITAMKQLLTSLNRFNQTAMEGNAAATKAFAEQINSDIKNLNRLLDPLRVLAKE